MNTAASNNDMESHVSNMDSGEVKKDGTDSITQNLQDHDGSSTPDKIGGLQIQNATAEKKLKIVIHQN